jgi:hypothetical protein
MSEKLVTSELPPNTHDWLATAKPCTNNFLKGPGQKHMQHALIPMHSSIVLSWEIFFDLDRPLVNSLKKVNN